MMPILSFIFAFLFTIFRSRLTLQLEIVALRHQLTVYQRSDQRLRTNPGDRMLWSWFARHWSGWQNAFVERVIGSIRRDCLNHVIVLNERHLKRILKSYFNYYHRWRTHLSLGMDSPESRPVQPPVLGRIIQFPEVGGLHHHYERLAA